MLHPVYRYELVSLFWCRELILEVCPDISDTSCIIADVIVRCIIDQC